MSDSRSEPKPPESKPRGGRWWEELRDRGLEWIDGVLNPPVPVPVPVRVRRPAR